MVLGKLLLSVLLSAPISARYLTITAGSSRITSTHCKTFVGHSSKSSVPTHSFLRTARPEVEVVLTATTPGTTVTPPAVTATDTVQTYTTTTITASTATGTFSTTTTLFKTESITATKTVVSTTTFTTTSVSTAVVTEPAPSGWITVKNSTGLKDVNDPAVLQGSDVQQPLQDDGSSGVKDHWPPWNLRRPGSPRPRNPWHDDYPASVTCFKTVWTRYIKMIVLVKHYTTTTTIPPATSTITNTQTVGSTSTVVPDGVTSVKSFSTTRTTTTTLTAVVTKISSATKLVHATTTTTSYAACFTENLLSEKLQNGLAIQFLGMADPLGKPDVQGSINTAYDCCVSCLLSSENCQYSTLLHYQDPPVCGRLLNPAICRGQDYETGAVLAGRYDPQARYQEASNGPCGKLVYPQDGPRVDRPPPAGLVEL
ncbi:MAG: hypothetical protein Q9197_004204 [Variospora fuerteventurae]